MTRAQQAERAEALARLREWLRPGDTVYTILRHVSRSGMQRSIAPIAFLNNDARDARYLARNVALALGMAEDRHREGVKINGCGMDMGAHLVYSLSSALFRDGFGCVGEGCPSSDHSNGDRDYTPHGAGEVGQWEDEGYHRKPLTWKASGHVHWHRDGGYALRQRWL